MTARAGMAFDLSGSITSLPAKIASIFATNNNPCALRDAQLLVAYMAGCEPQDLWRYNQHLTETEAARLDDLCRRRMQNEPVAYLTGVQAFWSLDFEVTPDTLIPRPDTEILVETGLDLLAHRQSPRILDMGTGSGCILISMLHEKQQAQGVGLDLSPAALDVARRNAQRCGVAERAMFRESDVFAALESGEHFELIVSNPPYIPQGDVTALMPDVRLYEPHSALDGGADGLDFYRRLTRQAHQWLAPRGALAVEVGAGQADVVAHLFEQAGYSDIQKKADLSGILRVVSGKKV